VIFEKCLLTFGRYFFSWPAALLAPIVFFGRPRTVYFVLILAYFYEPVQACNFPLISENWSIFLSFNELDPYVQPHRPLFGSKA
jgi:hypothetical protein